MESSNPVLTRSGWRAPATSSAGGTFGYADTRYADIRYAQPGAASGRMTVDDVVMRTLALLAVAGLVGALSWRFVPLNSSGLVVVFGALAVGLVLGLVISLKRMTNPALILTYAVVEGVLLGAVSHSYEDRYSGIVLQAVLGTFGVFAGMAALYRFRILRATPKFTRWVVGAVIGVAVLMLANLLLSFLGVSLGLRDGGPIAIVFSLVCIGVAALTFILDFAAIENGIAQGVEAKYAWFAAFGLLVGLVWLYLEILRLLGYARR